MSGDNIVFTSHMTNRPLPPIGGAAFNNEFGRPNLLGYFRSFELPEGADLVRAYDKPIMLAGGLGAIDRVQVDKIQLQAGDAVIVLGGPAMLIGLGVMALGFILMIGGKSADPKVFNDSDVYSFTRITIAPILIISGLLIEIFAIMKKPKES